MKQQRPHAYLKQYYNGSFMFERTKIWKAEDQFGNVVATGRTRRECEVVCRLAGYIPVKD